MSTELRDAIWNGDVEPVRRMLAADPALLEAADEAGVTPLMHAVSSMERSVAMVRLFLDAGADVNAKTVDGYTALHFAVDVVDCNEPHETVCKEVVNLLVNAGARLEERQHWGWTPLMKAVMRGDATEVAALLAVGANPNVFFPQHSMPGFTRGTSLLSAGVVCDDEVSRLMLRAGADVHAKDEHGETALEHAKRSLAESEPGRFREGVIRFIDLLREAGAKEQDVGS